MIGPRKIVAYKDSADEPTRFFGPFVSDSVADFFRASLPMPLKGGWARTISLQPFGVQDGHTVSKMIMSERQHA